MHNRLRIIIALVIGIAHPLTLANFLPMKGRWVGEQGWPVLGACILTEELRFLILYHSQQPPFWPPARRVKGRKIRRKRPPHPHLPLKPAEEEELEQPPEGWPKSPHELLDREACVALFERVRWAQGVVCPRCGSWAIRQIPPRTQAGLQCYHCLACQSLFHAATGTLFEHSPLSPTQWMVALLSFAQADSALERADQLAVSRRIGERWQRLFQVILYQQRPQEPLTGEVEVDELYHISGYKGHPNGLNPPRPPRRRRLKRRGRGELGEGQASHCGAGEAGRSHSPAGADQPAKGPMRPWLSTQIERGSRVYTDDYDIYDFLSQAGYGHRSVDHAAGEYARGRVHCNTAEAIWSLLRPYLCTFRGVSKLYLPLYVAVFEFQYNHRHLTTWQQAGVLLQRVFQADGAEIRKVVRENAIMEYCQLPT